MHKLIAVFSGLGLATATLALLNFYPQPVISSDKPVAPESVVAPPSIPSVQPQPQLQPDPIMERLVAQMNVISTRLETLDNKMKYVSDHSINETSIDSLNKALNQQISKMEILENRLREQHDAVWKANPTSSWNASSGAGSASEPYWANGQYWLKAADGTSYYNQDKTHLLRWVKHVNAHVSGQKPESDGLGSVCPACGVPSGAALFSVQPTSYTSASYSSVGGGAYGGYGADVVSSYRSSVSVKVGGGGGGILGGIGRIASGLGRVAVGSRRGKQSVVAVESYPVSQFYSSFQPVYSVTPSSQFASPQSPPVPLKSQPPLPSKSPGTVQPNSFFVPPVQNRAQAAAFFQLPGRR